MTGLKRTTPSLNTHAPKRAAARHPLIERPGIYSSQRASMPERLNWYSAIPTLPTTELKQYRLGFMIRTSVRIGRRSWACRHS